MRSWTAGRTGQQVGDEVGDQVVPLPLLHQQVALPGLEVVVGPRDPLTGQPARDDRALLVVGGVLPSRSPPVMDGS